VPQSAPEFVEKKVPRSIPEFVEKRKSVGL